LSREKGKLKIMSASVNKVTLIGTIGRDPEIRYTQAGSAICNLSLATNDRWKDKEGNKQEQCTWHRLSCFNKTAELVGQYLHKGSTVYVEGKIQNREYEKDGQKKQVTEILVHTIQFLDKKYEQPGGPISMPSQQAASAPAQAPQRPQSSRSSQSWGGGYAEPGSDADVPF
jgi:single-strand DNA-binding protein